MKPWNPILAMSAITTLGLLLLGACASGPAVAYVSPCGLEVMDYPGAPKQGDLVGVEFSATKTWPLVQCEALEGWRLFTRPDEKWVDVYGRTVAGTMSCETKSMEIGDASKGLRATAYVHELAHVAECPEENGGHEGWDQGRFEVPTAYGPMALSTWELIMFNNGSAASVGE